MVHAEPRTDLGQGQPGSVELSSLNDLVPYQVLVADKHSCFTEQPDNTALAETERLGNGR
jgi:hypothetical protein